MTKEETWKDISDYEGLYQVSNFGKVKSLQRGKEKILKGNINKCGYHYIILCNKGKKRGYNVHQLVAMSFLNHIPDGHKLIVDHINDIKTDNRVENLQIVTQRFNACKTQGKYSSKYKGVTRYKRSNNWISRIKINNDRKYLGCFTNEYDAHLAYEAALNDLH